MSAGRVKRNLAAAALLAAVAFPGLVGSAAAQAPAGSAAANPSVRPLVIGHRGAAGLLPENTLAAFRRGCELGIDAIELDVLMSADGELVVHHDFRLRPEIARTWEGAKRCSILDAGYLINTIERRASPAPCGRGQRGGGFKGVKGTSCG
jgi:glycerophosphoryl diester phosphodiesterase